MLEDNGGLAPRKDRRINTKMTNAMIEILAKASQHTSKGDLNSFHAQIGEVLPKNVERNFSGLLF